MRPVLLQSDCSLKEAPLCCTDGIGEGSGKNRAPPHERALLEFILPALAVRSYLCRQTVACTRCWRLPNFPAQRWILRGQKIAVTPNYSVPEIWWWIWLARVNCSCNSQRFLGISPSSSVSRAAISAHRSYSGSQYLLWDFRRNLYRSEPYLAKAIQPAAEFGQLCIQNLSHWWPSTSAWTAASQMAPKKPRAMILQSCRPSDWWFAESFELWQKRSTVLLLSYPVSGGAW